MTKKILSAVIALIMVSALVPMSAFARNAEKPAEIKKAFETSKGLGETKSALSDKPVVASRAKNVTVDDDTIFYCNFESDPEEAGWEFVEHGGDSNYNWQWAESNYSSNATSGTGVLYHHYEAESDDFAVFPGPITIGKNGAVLTLYASVNSDYYPETFSLWAGSTNDVDQMTRVGSELTIDNEEPEEFEFDLSGFANQSVYFALRYTSDDMYYLFIDDILITAIPEPVAPEEIIVNDLTVAVGESAPLVVTFDPPTNVIKTVTYKSDDESIATVDEDGVVTGVRVGTAHVTVTSTEEGVRPVTATISVVGATLPESITVSPATFYLQENGTRQLTWTFDENANVFGVVFSSSDETVATVDQTGLVTAVGVGTATIRVKSAQCETYGVATVTVQDEPTYLFDFDEITGLEDLKKNGWRFVDDDGVTSLRWHWDEMDDGYYTSPYGVLYASYTSNASDWAILPKVHVGEGGGSFGFYARSYTSYYGYESFEICVGTSNDPADMESVYVNDAVPTSFGYYDIDLSDYAGQDIFLSIHYTSDDIYYLLVDDVQLWGDVRIVLDPPTSIVFNDFVMCIGDTLNLNYTLLPVGCDPDVTITIPENDPYVSLDGEVVTAIGVGSTTVTITSNANPDLAPVTANVTVLDYPDYLFDFENAYEYGNWLAVDSDGDGYDWFYFNNVSDSGDPYAHSGIGLLTSASYNNSGALTPDNWLISPAITVNGKSARFGFYADGQDPAWPSEEFGVYLGTSTDVDDMVPVYPAPMGLGQDPGTFTSTANYVLYSFEIPADYAGQTVYVAIRHYNCTDMFRLNIDDVCIWGDVDFPEMSDFSCIYEGNDVVFVESDNPWLVATDLSSDLEDPDHFAVSGDAVTTTLEAAVINVISGDSISFSYYASEYVNPKFYVDGVNVFTDFTRGSWKTFEYQFTSGGQHTVVWECQPTKGGDDYFAIDDIEIIKPVAPEIVGAEAQLRNRDLLDGRQDIRFVYTVQFHRTNVTFTPTNGTAATYGYRGDDALSITGLDAYAHVEGFEEQHIQLHKILNIDDTTSDAVPSFWVVIAINGIQQNRFSTNYYTRLVVTYGNDQTVESEQQSATVNGLLGQN